MKSNLFEKDSKIILNSDKTLKNYDFVRLCFSDLNGIHLSKFVSTRHAEKIMKAQCEIFTGITFFGPRCEVSVCVCVCVCGNI